VTSAREADGSARKTENLVTRRRLTQGELLEATDAIRRGFGPAFERQGVDPLCRGAARNRSVRGVEPLSELVDVQAGSDRKQERKDISIEVPSQ
jgi:hypothetical protein